VITFTDDGTTANCSIEVHVILLAEQQYFLQNKSTVYVEPNDVNDSNYNQITEKFVEITGTSAGSSVVQRYWGGDRNQRWDVTYDVNYECYKFKSVEAGKYLGNDNGSVVLLAGTFDSRWLIAQTSSGGYTIKHSTHKNSTLVLAVEDIAEDENNSNNTSNRDNLIFKIFETDNSSHEWIFHPVFINLPTVPDDPDNPDLNGEIPYQPELWNDGGEIQGRTNCYAYALNTQVKPDIVGANDYMDLSGFVMYPGISSDEDLLIVRPYLITEDGKYVVQRVMTDAATYGFAFEKIGRYEVCEPGCYKVALVLDILWGDYHWYRQNPSGIWSHKIGDMEVSLGDASENFQSIIDPLIADRNYAKDNPNLRNYSEFIGYFQVSPLNTMAQ